MKDREISISLKGINFSIEKARRLQAILSKKVICEDQLAMPIKYVAGVDVAYTNEHSVGAVVVLDYNSMKSVEKKIAVTETRFPYIPTLLSFREIPPVVSAIRKLTIKPDVLLVDGQGRAHPHRLGFASHLGVILDVATIGVAKNILCGRVAERENKFWKPIIYEEEIIGGVVFTRLDAKPVYVSIGHKISLETAIKIVLACSRGYRIPEPIRKAHMIAEKTKRMLLKNE